MVYGLSSTGMTLHFHYCCGKLDKIDFNAPTKDNFPLSSRFIQKNCCDSKTIEFKIKSEYKAEVQAAHTLKDFKPCVGFVYPVFEIPLFISYRPLHFSGVSPPLSASVPLYIFDCVYRI